MKELDNLLAELSRYNEVSQPEKAWVRDNIMRRIEELVKWEHNKGMVHVWEDGGLLFAEPNRTVVVKIEDHCPDIIKGWCRIMEESQFTPAPDPDDYYPVYLLKQTNTPSVYTLIEISKKITEICERLETLETKRRKR